MLKNGIWESSNMMWYNVAEYLKKEPMMNSPPNIQAHLLGNIFGKRMCVLMSCVFWESNS